MQIEASIDKFYQSVVGVELDLKHFISFPQNTSITEVFKSE